MEINDVINVQNQEYLILDIVEFKKEKYYYTVQIDTEEKPTQEYKYFKGILDSNEWYVEEVHDENILQILLSMVTTNYLESSKNEEQDV